MEKGKVYKKGLLIDYIHYNGTNEHLFIWKCKGREIVKESDLNDYLDEIGYIRKEKEDTNLKDEIWKPINNQYSISNKGRVKNNRLNRLVKPFKHNRKVIVNVTENGKTKQIGIATSVARIFIGEHVRKVVRIDRNIYNNNLENLKVYE
jgi:hypothetical protein